MQRNNTHASVKKMILDKFGTLRKFHELTGQSYDFIREFVNRPDDDIAKDEEARIVKIMEVCESTEVTKTSYELTEENCQAIKNGVIAIHGSLSAFAREKSKWSESGISDLVNGRRKRKSTKVKTLVLDLVSAFEVRGEVKGLTQYESFIANQLKQILDES